jgi:transcriptional regulator with XRE-family HTH domain
LNIFLGKTARHLRESLGLTQRATAKALGISFVHLCNIENNKSTPSPRLLERYQTNWGVDLYVMAWCMDGDLKRLPNGLRRATSELADAWRAELDTIISRKQKKA